MQAMLPSSSGTGVSSPEQIPSSSADADQRIDDALLNAEDCITLSMWDEAAAALDALPPEAKHLPHVVLVSLDLMIGQQLWERGLLHALGLLEARPHDSELWLRIARLMAGAGNMHGAHTAAEQCMELNPESYFFLVKNGIIDSRDVQNATRKKTAERHLYNANRKVA